MAIEGRVIVSIENMTLWNAVCKTDPAHTKKLKLGREITAIDPYRQIEAATAMFGAVGEGWGWSVGRVDHLSTNEVCVLVSMWHGTSGNRFEQWGQASLYIDKAQQKKDTDCMKKATTDGITKCLSMLGFNADIFLGKYDDNKYVQMVSAEFAAKKPVELSDNDKQWISACKANPDDIKQIEDPAYRDFIAKELLK
jgi:hypothetical protein